MSVEIVTEEWRDVAGFPGYQVSSLGRVRSFWKLTPIPRKGSISSIGEASHIMSPGMATSGYWQVTFRKDKKSHIRSIHRTVLIAFVGPPPDGCDGCHNNGIRTDNRASNLRWDTKKNNCADAKIHGTMPLGERRAFAKMTDEGIKSIRKFVDDGWTKTFVGRLFGIGQPTVSVIAHRKTWKHVL